MKRNKYLLLLTSLGVLALLLVAIVQENILRPWRQIQASTLSETSAGVEVRLRQIVVPGLRATDRCVSCHVGMSPGEQVAGEGIGAKKHPPVVHDPADFGCTVCHGGQGRATEKADAHGTAPFWPEPMIPVQYAHAGCGSCHTHVRVPEQTALQRGQNVLERYDCLACHRMNGRGGTLRPGVATPVDGPDLSVVGAAGYDAKWYNTHLAQSQAAADGPWKNSFTEIADADRAAIEVLLDSSVGAPKLVQAKALFHSMGCRGCHKIGGVGGDDGPDLTQEGQKDPARLDYTNVKGPHTLQNWLVEHFRSPATIVPGSKMPDLGLSEETIDLLTYYMMSLRRSNFPEAYWPKDRVRAERLGEREFATDGKTLYGTFCASCHGTQGEGMRYPGMAPFPAIGNIDFLSVASDEFIRSTIQHGRPGRRMPAWGEQEGGLRPEEIENVIAHLRTLGDGAKPTPDGKPDRWANPDTAAAGAQLYKSYCAGCHGAEGQGVEGLALNNLNLQKFASDSYLFETIKRGRRGTSMAGFAYPSAVTPALTDAQIESIVAHLRTWEKPQP